jgi:endo-1,4-beta-mannosidase
MYTLWMKQPVFDHRDCIRGTTTMHMPEYGAFETAGMAAKKADMLYTELRLDLGDGEMVLVFKDGKPLPRVCRDDGPDDWECPF